MKLQARQGDVLLVKVADLPRGAKPVEVKGDIILMHGEVTGHAHRLRGEPGQKPKVLVFDFAAERYLQVLERVTLTHEEHGAIVFEAGVYKQAFQVEDFGVDIRQVLD